MDCNLGLDRCADRCGAYRGDGLDRPTPQEREQRQRELKAMLDKMEQPAPEPAEDATPQCQALYDLVTQVAIRRDGTLRAECPDRATFTATCKVVKPEVVRCLNPRVMRAERAQCQRLMEQENPERAAAMNRVLSRCYPLKNDP